MWAWAPRWAWPQPTRSGAARLPPHSRPKLIRSQLQKFCAGEWIACLDLQAQHQPMGTSSRCRCGWFISTWPHHTIVLDQLRKSAFQQRLGKGWRQFWSWGDPARGVDVSDQLLELLIPEEVSVEPVPECPTVMGGYIMRPYTEATWQRALRGFSHGRAQDACGWTQEVIMDLSKHPKVHKILRQIATGILTSA